MAATEGDKYQSPACMHNVYSDNQIEGTNNGTLRNITQLLINNVQQWSWTSQFKFSKHTSKIMYTKWQHIYST